MIKLIYTGAALAASTLAANAAITMTADSSAFDYKYEMDVNPSGQNLDGAGSANDWFAGTSGSAKIPQTYTGGEAFSNQSASTPEILFRTDFGGSITRQQFSDTAAMTLELSVRKVGGTQGTLGWFGAALQMPGATDSIVVAFADDRISIRNIAGQPFDDSFTDYLVGTDFTTGQHTLRVAKESGNNWYVWVNDTLLNADLSTPMAGANGNFNDGGSWFIGDYSGTGYAGDWAVDYIRLEKDGAFAPVPEPSSAALLGLGGLALVLRRRK